MVAKIIPRDRIVTVAHWFCPDVSCLPVAVGDSLLMYSAQDRNLGSSVVKSIVPANNPGTVNGTSPNVPNVSYTDNSKTLPPAWSVLLGALVCTSKKPLYSKARLTTHTNTSQRVTQISD